MGRSVVVGAAVVVGGRVVVGAAVVVTLETGAAPSSGASVVGACSGEPASSPAAVASPPSSVGTLLADAAESDTSSDPSPSFSFGSSGVSWAPATSAAISSGRCCSMLVRSWSGDGASIDNRRSVAPSLPAGRSIVSPLSVFFNTKSSIGVSSASTTARALGLKPSHASPTRLVAPA